MALSADAPIKHEVGDYNKLPALQSTKIYEGAIVGLSSGYARGLVAGDTFVGHSKKQVDNSSGASGAEDVELLTGVYKLQVAVTGASAVTDVGTIVYASDDGTYTLTASTNTRVGVVYRWVTSTTCIVEFHPMSSGDLPDHGHTAASDGGALTSPRVVTSINDTNGAELMKVTATGSAVNELTLANAATGNDPSVTASGTDTNIGIDVITKGTGVFSVVADDTDAIQVQKDTNVKIGFFGVTPVVQQTHVADLATNLATNSTTSWQTIAVAQNSVLARLRSLGFLATA